MPSRDLNLLTALNALLAEGSVAKAAQRLEVSISAMSRTLTRLRELTGDPLLVRGGRGLVPTPRALELREPVARILRDAQAVFNGGPSLDLAHLQRTFAIRANEGFVQAFGAAWLARLRQDAPGVCLRFVPKADKAVAPLRDGSVDMDIGVLGDSGPEVRVQMLFSDHFIGVVRKQHPLASIAMTPEHYAACSHVSVSRRGHVHGPIDAALAQMGLQRDIAIVVPSFPAALALVAESDLVASVPARQTVAARAGLHSFELPVATPELTVMQMWHPRLDADAAHTWLRSCLREICADLR